MRYTRDHTSHQHLAAHVDPPMESSGFPSQDQALPYMVLRSQKDDYESVDLPQETFNSRDLMDASNCQSEDDLYRLVSNILEDPDLVDHNSSFMSPSSPKRLWSPNVRREVGSKYVNNEAKMSPLTRFSSGQAGPKPFFNRSPQLANRQNHQWANKPNSGTSCHVSSRKRAGSFSQSPRNLPRPPGLDTPPGSSPLSTERCECIKPEEDEDWRGSSKGLYDYMNAVNSRCFPSNKMDVFPFVSKDKPKKASSFSPEDASKTYVPLSTCDANYIKDWVQNSVYLNCEEQNLDHFPRDLEFTDQMPRFRNELSQSCSDLRRAEMVHPSLLQSNYINAISGFFQSLNPNKDAHQLLALQQLFGGNIPESLRIENERANTLWDKRSAGFTADGPFPQRFNEKPLMDANQPPRQVSNQYQELGNPHQGQFLHNGPSSNSGKGKSSHRQSPLVQPSVAYSASTFQNGRGREEDRSTFNPYVQESVGPRRGEPFTGPPMDKMKLDGGPGTANNDLHYVLEKCYEQCWMLEKERKQAEALLIRSYPERSLLMDSSVVSRKMPPKPSRVERLIVDQLREQASVVCLLAKMEELRNVPLQANVVLAMDRHLDAIYMVQARRMEATNQKRQTLNFFTECKAVFLLGSAVKNLSSSTRNARTALWGALQTTLCVSPVFLEVGDPEESSLCHLMMTL